MTTKPYIVIQVEGGLISYIGHNYPFDLKVIISNVDLESRDSSANIEIVPPTAPDDFDFEVPYTIRRGLAHFAYDEEIWACIESGDFEPLMED